MPIQVTCPSCLKRFQVSDKFAGKSGPCPNCQKPIRVPDKTEEVVVHAPRDDSPKDSKGQSVLKPIERQDDDFTRRHLVIASVALLGIVAVAFALRMLSDSGTAPVWAQVAGVLLLAPPLVRVGYAFVRDGELAPYTGSELRNRVLICSVLFAALWLLYAFVPSYVFQLEAAAEMSWPIAGVIFSVMLVLGALASVASFELEFPSGLAHAGLYLVFTMLVGLLSGVTLAGREPAPLIPAMPPAAVATDSGPPAAENAGPETRPR